MVACRHRYFRVAALSRCHIIESRLRLHDMREEAMPVRAARDISP